MEDVPPPTDLILVGGADLVALTTEDNPVDTGLLRIDGKDTEVLVAMGPVAVGFRNTDHLAETYCAYFPPAVIWTVHTQPGAWHFRRYVILVSVFENLAGGFNMFLAQARLPLGHKDRSDEYLRCVMQLAIESEEYDGASEPVAKTPAVSPWSLDSIQDTYMF